MTTRPARSLGLPMRGALLGLVAAVSALVLLKPGTARAAPDVARGEEIVQGKCFICHGAGGESSSPVFPRLAGQNASYVARQLADSATDEHQLSAATSLAARWADHDPVAASEWLIAEPASPMRDAAIRAFTHQLAANDPSSALEWAAVIGDSETRWGTLKSGVHDWLDKDPVAAREWVQSSHTLTTQDRERLLVRTGQ